MVTANEPATIIARIPVAYAVVLPPALEYLYVLSQRSVDHRAQPNA